MNAPDDLTIWRELALRAQTGRRCALATVVHTRGSTPRKTGTKMILDSDGGLVGTVGGGCGEAEVLEVAWRVLESGVPEIVHVDLTQDILSWSPAVCGGVMEVFVEAVLADGKGAAG